MLSLSQGIIQNPLTSEQAEVPLLSKTPPPTSIPELVERWRSLGISISLGATPDSIVLEDGTLLGPFWYMGTPGPLRMLYLILSKTMKRVGGMKK